MTILWPFFMRGQCHSDNERDCQKTLIYPSHFALHFFRNVHEKRPCKYLKRKLRNDFRRGFRVFCGSSTLSVFGALSVM